MKEQLSEGDDDDDMDEFDGDGNKKPKRKHVECIMGDFTDE